MLNGAFISGREGVNQYQTLGKCRRQKGKQGELERGIDRERKREREKV